MWEFRSPTEILPLETHNSSYQALNPLAPKWVMSRCLWLSTADVEKQLLNTFEGLPGTHPWGKNVCLCITRRLLLKDNSIFLFCLENEFKDSEKPAAPWLWMFTLKYRTVFSLQSEPNCYWRIRIFALQKARMGVMMSWPLWQMRWTFLNSCGFLESLLPTTDYYRFVIFLLLKLIPDHMHMFLTCLSGSLKVLYYCDCWIIKTKLVGLHSRFSSVIHPVQLLYSCFSQFSLFLVYQTL